MITRICASKRSQRAPCRILASDAKRAYFFARAKRPIFIEIPTEDGEEGDEDMVGRLNLSLYGTRGSAQNWQAESIEYFVNNGFAKGASSPFNFHMSQRQLHSIVHGDDFTTIGPETGLKWCEQLLNQRHGCKHKLFGPGGGQTLGVLNRALSWNKDGTSFGADRRHA